MRSIPVLLCLLVLASCKKDVTQDITAKVTGTFTQAQISTQVITPNPSGYAPLTARLDFSTNIPTTARIRVVGKNGAESDVTKTFDTLNTFHALPILGLYAGYANTVELTLYDSSGSTIGTSSITIEESAISTDLPSIRIDATQPGKRPGMTLVSYLAANKPFIFDAFGDVRWYLDYSSNATLSSLNYDDGLERLRNGNLYFGDISSGAIYEVDMMGYIVNSWPLTGYTFHHKVLEKPDGNFLVTVSGQGLGTVEDKVIELDRKTGQITNVWDLRQSLQYGRTTLTTNTSDWLHINAVEYDPSDNTIIVSGRTQCVVKLDYSNKVKWIIAPHKDWGIAGDGTDLNTKLLQPLDAAGQPITDTAVISGFSNHSDFEWNWCQHAVKVAQGNNISMFDNGDQRNYVTSGPYSRAVIYHVDPVAMTIKQVWQYGKERGAATFSRILSDVDYHADVNHVIFSPGDVNTAGSYGKVVEVDYATLAVLFEATITPPGGSSGGSAVLTFHRTERLSLYP